MNDEIFSVYAALDNLNKRLKKTENTVPDYNADILEIYRNLGVMSKRMEAIEERLERLEKKFEVIT